MTRRISFFSLRGLALGTLAAILPAATHAAITYDAATHVWHLNSGPVEYRLGEKDGAVSLLYFGPVGGETWESRATRPSRIGGQDDPQPPRSQLAFLRFDVGGQVDAQELRPEDLQFESQQILAPSPGKSELALRFKHRRLPLEVEVRYATCGETGVITREAKLTNRGDHALAMDSAPSLAWLLPPGDYELSYLYGVMTGGEERQLATEKLGVGQRTFVNRTGRSSNGYSPWFCLQNTTTHIRYAAQLAYSGNWQMSFERFTKRRRTPLADQDLRVEMGLRFDFARSAPLQPGASFSLPLVAFTASAGDLDTAANQLHRYQRQFVVPKTPANQPLITQFNTWRLGRSPTIAQLKPHVDIAAELGLEAIGTDAAWVVKQDGTTLYGDWRADPIGFPNGIKELADYVHAKGMKFCVWLEPESVSKLAPIAVQHPDWILRNNGVPMEGTRNRVHIDYRRADVRQWMRGVVDRLVREDGVDWLKLDYNADVGERFDEPAGKATGTVLYDHLRGYKEWIDGIRAAYPNLILENCSSGGLRMDLAMLGLTDFTWISDVVTPKSSLEIAWGTTLEFLPEASFHWASGDDNAGHFDVKADPGWWDFIFRGPMNGVYAIGSLPMDWSPELKRHAAENVALYKRIRDTIAGSDVYHLTSQPASGEHPTGWMALQYAHEKDGRSAVLAYRLAASEPSLTLHLRGLQPGTNYTVSENGREQSVRSGRDLMETGLECKFAAEWRASVFEIVPKP